MKTKIQVKQQNKNILTRLGRWLNRKFSKLDTYESHGDLIIPGRGEAPQFKVQDVLTWQQIFIDFGVPVIVVKFADGRAVELSDKHEELLHILQQIAPEKELPWKAV